MARLAGLSLAPGCMGRALQRAGDPGRVWWRAPWIVGPLALGCALWMAGAEPPEMPAWLTPFPGATVTTRVLTSFVLSRYETTASTDEVVEHYRALFATAGLPFHPGSNPLATTIRGSLEECDLSIGIGHSKTGTSVTVMCTAWPNHMSPAARREAEAKGIEGQAKFDRPVYPKPRPPIPPLAWPDWLTTCDPGITPEIASGVDRFRSKFLKAEFVSPQSRDAVLAFYTDLLNSHDYPVSLRSSPITPPGKKVLVDGQHFFGERPGPRFTVHVEVTPVSAGVDVQILITAHPF